MKLIIFGATGMVGKQLVEQALHKGHQVKAFGRNVHTTDYLKESDDKNLELVQGALFDDKEVFNAIKDCNAVLSAIGGAMDGTDKARTLGIKNIIKQMDKASVKRIVALGGLGVLNAPDEGLLIDKDDYPAEYRAVGLEHKKAYEYLNESNLDWTFVCAPNIINAEPTGSFNTNANYPPEPNNYKINAGDLALFMIGELEKNQFVKQRVGISN